MFYVLHRFMGLPIRQRRIGRDVPREPQRIHALADRAEDLRTRAREKSRVHALAALAQPLAAAFPALLALSIADMGISTRIMSATKEACTEVERARDAEEYGLRDEDNDSSGGGWMMCADEWDKLRRLPRVRLQRWWRIVDDGAGSRRLVEISEAEGERAKAAIDSPDCNAETGLDGMSSLYGIPDRVANAAIEQICSPRCRYAALTDSAVYCAVCKLAAPSALIVDSSER